jgi:hypothetical protein
MGYGRLRLQRTGALWPAATEPLRVSSPDGLTITYRGAAQ